MLRCRILFIVTLSVLGRHCKANFISDLGSSITSGVTTATKAVDSAANTTASAVGNATSTAASAVDGAANTTLHAINRSADCPLDLPPVRCSLSWICQPKQKLACFSYSKTQALC